VGAAPVGSRQGRAPEPCGTLSREPRHHLPPPSSLRWLPRCKHPGGVFLPAMIAKVVNVDGELIGIHRTFLLSDGSGKADVDKEQQKMSLGSIAGGSVRLAAAETILAITEGVETGLSVQQAAGIPTWAAISASGIRALALPRGVDLILICADHDRNGVGEEAALTATARFLAEGRRVKVIKPPTPDTDFNDLLRRGK
jgi:putative DNA primase/helicase